MIDDQSGPSVPVGDGLTVGSLLGQPQGRQPIDLATTPGTVFGAEVKPSEIEGRDWQVSGGVARVNRQRPGFSESGVEWLDYNNPYNQDLERVWFDGKIVYALDVGEVDIDPTVVKVAQEYQVVSSVELDDQGRLRGEPEVIAGQYNIYDSVPGMGKYSPIWQFNYVVVPRDYKANTLRSEADCLRGGFPVHRSNVFEN